MYAMLGDRVMSKVVDDETYFFVNSVGVWQNMEGLSMGVVV
jgi:hypothetical protein